MVKSGGVLNFDTERNLIKDDVNVDEMETDRQLPSGDNAVLSYEELAETMLGYAKELEKIV